MRIKVFIDTNILVDVLLGNRPHSAASRGVFQAIYNHLAEGVIASQSLVDASYILGRIPDASFTEQFLDIVNRFNLAYVDLFAVKQSCTDFTGDFEDDALYHVALNSGCDVIVTSDKTFIKTYCDKTPGLLIMTPEEFVEKITAED